MADFKEREEQAGGADRDEWITSVGVDLGTSTTKLIFSRLRVAKVSDAASLPAYRIAERVIDYASAMHRTPLEGEDRLDLGRIAALLAEEYRRAGRGLSDVQTGAVIITGETANKANAAEALHELAGRAGDFVVATAGADLEAMLAGKGSGAEAYSARTGQTVLNVDVGGGTANAAFFRSGELVATVTLRVGGRLIELDASGEAINVAAAIRPWLRASGFDVARGQRCALGEYEAVAASMADALLGYLTGRTASGCVSTLLVGEAPPLLPPFDALMLSGGVAALAERAKPASIAEAAAYGDIGLLLADALVRAADRMNLRRVAAAHTSRATVIGAGTRTVEISGATVHVAPGVLPIRNLPVVRVALPDYPAAEAMRVEAEIAGATEVAMRRYGEAAAHGAGGSTEGSGGEERGKTIGEGPDVEERGRTVGEGLDEEELGGAVVEDSGQGRPDIPVAGEGANAQATASGDDNQGSHAPDHRAPCFALLLASGSLLSYADLQIVADGIASASRIYLPDAVPVIVVCERDMAKALGQSLSLRFGSERKVVCLDGISAGDGDYIDLGEPLSGRAIVPVIVKTLAFAAGHSEEETL
ncbi:ethanolamine ammonia-lyase reactivating factor EutA [Paenibacillus methanolicus]|uniref:Ethanolamine utilization protein EutA (Predicted chaperonin) n=1 Tax=Paenibacillus methanolicus TaxID=582686 RepID=A0A5S5C878_9BACL|nr:ethanolamine ammonia-lyase reactivating factor EutA [Paenibacillus methanolicus]TYP75611.1 ethanolamine utilization protein EutA (predicted chaperonin) [Paenibacillus methanolicus]